jgi:RNA polymerase sigma-70 factor (ECF subfamily)
MRFRRRRVAHWPLPVGWIDVVRSGCRGLARPRHTRSAPRPLTGRGRSVRVGVLSGRRLAAQPADPAFDLVEAARAGDHDARARIFDRYHGAIYRYAVARLGIPADAEDAVAETFLWAFRSLPQFRWRGVPFEAWLFRIASSKVVDTARRRRRAMLPLDGIAVEPVDHASDPVQGVDRKERHEELVEALDELPAAQRDVLVLRFLLGRSVADVARSMRRSEGAVKQLQARALANLRRRLDE